MLHSTKIADLVGTIIEQADGALVDELAQAIGEFAAQSPEAFNGVQCTPFAEALMEAMVVATDASIGYSE